MGGHLNFDGGMRPLYNLSTAYDQADASLALQQSEHSSNSGGIF